MKKDETKISAVDWRMMLLANMVLSVDREKLYVEGMKSCDNKFKANTLRRNIYKKMQEALAPFDKWTDEIQKEIVEKSAPFTKRINEMTRPKADAAPEEVLLFQEKREEVIREFDPVQQEIQDKFDVVNLTYNIPNPVTVIKRKDDTKGETITINLDSEYNQLEFLRELFDLVIFKNKSISDELISDVSEIIF